ncbi:FadR/GntR family transcriptional regulator [Marinoscillum furvescens]|uniref:GntR family transcriptional repressor for pyruvate dehydrogenase complex n=1 Tax=Marinoscillum furvescens DSM 4134 TaxID=1122208 RepID=A0A3D9L6J4_MARFU|nr:FadR/GntR family transcriptional regulator [Marinoscillum furvescens]REE00197.1 GntR family transcriptional repressor for pyruvate dehydrogenase complex [Marinoscillum furvescens DSM 4134]
MFQQLGNKKSLSLQVEESLTEAIRSGKFSPGQKIPTENELCEIFNVSRTAIREAIKKMNARGILDVRKGSGAYVSEISVQNASETLNMFFELSSDKDLVRQTIKTRQLIEPLIAKEAAKVRSDKHIVLLTKNMEAMIRCDLEDKKKEADLDNDFHQILLSTTENSVLQLLISPIFNLMPKFKSSVFAKPNDGDLINEKNIMIKHHENILSAVSNQDSNAAYTAMKEHLETTYHNYLTFQP